MRRRWIWLLLIAALGLGVWLLPRFVPLPITVAEGYEQYGTPMNHPVSEVKKDDRPAFRIDPKKPWVIEFGRGSGWHGLDTAKLDQDGRLILYRLREDRWETAAAQLPPGTVAEVLEAVKANRLLELDRAYHAAVCDGTQWVLSVRQGDREKALYFNNHFPDPIVGFAERFDAVVAGSVGPALRWRAVPSAWARDHERELWQSINR
jgi:hypothetical protein